MHVKLFKLENYLKLRSESFLKIPFFFRYCGQSAPKFENTVFDLGRARWLIIFNNTLHKERGIIIFNEDIKLWLYNSVKKSDHKFLQLFVLAWHNLVKVIIQRKLAVNSNFLILISLQPYGVHLQYFKHWFCNLKYLRFTTLGCKDIEISSALY